LTGQEKGFTRILQFDETEGIIVRHHHNHKIKMDILAELLTEKITRNYSDLSLEDLRYPVLDPNTGSIKTNLLKGTKGFTRLSELVYVAAVQRHDAELERMKNSGKSISPYNRVRYSEVGKLAKGVPTERLVKLSDVLLFSSKILGLGVIAPVEKPFLTVLASMVSGLMKGRLIDPERSDSAITHLTSNYLKINYKRRYAVMETVKSYQLAVTEDLSDLKNHDTFYRLSPADYWIEKIKTERSLSVKKAKDTAKLFQSSLLEKISKTENRMMNLSFIDVQILLAVLIWYGKNKTGKRSPFTKISDWSVVIDSIIKTITDDAVSNFVEPRYRDTESEIFMDSIFDSDSCQVMPYKIFLHTLNRLVVCTDSLTERHLKTIYSAANCKPKIRTRQYGHSDFLFVVNKVVNDDYLRGLCGGLRHEFINPYTDAIAEMILSSTNYLGHGKAKY
jgi:hypothetical protein